MTQPNRGPGSRTVAALSGIAAGTLCFLVMQAHLLAGLLLLAALIFAGVLVVLARNARRDRELNRQAAATFRPTMTDAAPSRGIDEGRR